MFLIDIVHFFTSIDWPEDFIAALLHYQALIASVFLLTIEESGIPLPVPGDITITFIGYQVAKEHLPYYAALLSLMAAVLVGSSILFFISRRWGHLLVARVGKYMQLDEERLDYVEKKFRKYGPLVIIFGRHIPGFRIPITVFSGISGVPYWVFISSTFVSIIPWIYFYLSVGEHLGPRAAAALLHLNRGRYFLFVIIPIVVLVGLYFFTKYHKKKLEPEKKKK